MEEKSKGQQLKETLFHKSKNVYDVLDDCEIKQMNEYAEAYKKYLDLSKTEREAVKTSITLAEKEGYVEYKFGMEIVTGGKYYFNNRGKALYLFVIGTECVENGVYISGAHIDSPRIDLKQHPLYQDSGMGFFKTHYYGGIKKYQWTATPLSLHGTIMRADGSIVDIVIGEDESDPIFYINDLLIHLAKDQMARSLADGITGEGLNILIGSVPFKDDSVDEKIKLNILSILNEKYGITESDFISAELTVVPAFKSRDIGFDRSLVGGYGHDDRVCAYPAITALFDTPNPTKTIMAVLSDKEETGSDGNTGMNCRVFADLLDEIAKAFNVNPNILRANSKCLSADVNAAFDPNFAEVYERRNSASLNEGVVMTKFTGSRGKSGTSDANAEYVGYVRNLFDANNIVWQTGELGKVDQGGGGTIAAVVANLNIDTIDLGVPVLSMHAPYEVIAKADLFMTYKAFKVFNQ
jgi:Aspartyl aminopeptidase